MWKNPQSTTGFTDEKRKISDKARSGRPPKITDDDEKEIHCPIDEKDPKKYGINASSYTTKDLQLYFAKKPTRYLLFQHHHVGFLACSIRKRRY